MNHTTSIDATETLNQHLSTFIEYWYQQQSEHNPQHLLIEFDEQWPSPCYLYEAQQSDQTSGSQRVKWQPVKQTTQDMFCRLSDALDAVIHPDIITYYTSYYSNNIQASSADGDLELLQVWNPQDMERLRSNLIGHALDKKKRRQPLSFFFAITTPDEGMLCLDNNSGEIWYEIPGKKPVRKIANSMSEFILSLQPNLAPDD